MRSERASDLSSLSYWRPPRFPKRQYKEWGGSEDEPSVVAARGVRLQKAEVIRQCWASGLSQGGSGRGCFRDGVAVSLAVAKVGLELCGVVMALNDCKGWSFTQIADWLETDASRSAGRSGT